MKVKSPCKLIIATIAVTLTILAACHKKEPKSINPAEVFNLSEKEIENLEKKAEAGSDGGESAKRLSRYYSFYLNDGAAGRKWLEKAKNQGNKQAQKDWDVLQSYKPSPVRNSP